MQRSFEIEADVNILKVTLDYVQSPQFFTIVLHGGSHQRFH